MNYLSNLIDKKISLNEAADIALKDDPFLSELMTGILAKKDEIRFNCYEVLRTIAEKNPERLYTHWDHFSGLLDSDNHYQRFIAINLLANLVHIDTEGKFEAIMDKYFDNIAGDRTMVAGQAALNAGKIARAKPSLQTLITDRLINIGHIHQGKQTELMKAYAITALDDYFPQAIDKQTIIDFVKKQLHSDSPKTKKVAYNFLKKYQIFFVSVQ